MQPLIPFFVLLAMALFFAIGDWLRERRDPRRGVDATADCQRQKEPLP